MQRENSEANTASTIIDKKTPTQFSLHNALILSSSIVREMKCVCVLLSLHLWFLPVSQWNIKTRSLWLGIGEYNHTKATFPDQTAKTKLLLFFLQTIQSLQISVIKRETEKVGVTDRREWEKEGEREGQRERQREGERERGREMGRERRRETERERERAKETQAVQIRYETFPLQKKKQHNPLICQSY